MQIYETDSEFYADLYEYLMDIKDSGRKIVGYFAHEFLPPELIDAAGAFPLPLIFAGNEESMTIGGDYLNPSTCSYAKSVIGLFKQAEEIRKYRFLKLVDGIIVSNYCTANLLASDTIARNFGIKPLEFYIPHLRDKHHVEWYRERLEILARELTEFTGTELSDDALIKSMRKYNKFREELSSLFSRETGLTHTELINLIANATVFGPDGADLGKYLEAPPRDFGKVKKRVILSGCSAFIGDYLPELIGEAGGTVVYDDTWIGGLMKYQNTDIDSEESVEDPIGKLAEVMVKYGSSAHSIPYSVEAYAERLGRIASETDTRAVIYHIIKFCDIIGYHRQFLKERLQEIGLKVLLLERDYGREMKGQLLTRIEAFLEII